MDAETINTECHCKQDICNLAIPAHAIVDPSTPLNLSPLMAEPLVVPARDSTGERGLACEILEIRGCCEYTLHCESDQAGHACTHQQVEDVQLTQCIAHSKHQRADRGPHRLQDCYTGAGQCKRDQWGSLIAQQHNTSRLAWADSLDHA